MGCDIHTHIEIKRGGRWDHIGTIDLGRNYRLFSVLASVRNGNNDAVPISAPKGLPGDAAGWTRYKHKDWEADAHSSSWLTVRELKEYEWDKKFEIRGVISSEQAVKLIDDGEAPTHWCSYTNAPGHEEAAWKSTYREAVGPFFFKIIAALSCLGDSDDVRLVFWFDN